MIVRKLLCRCICNNSTDSSDGSSCNSNDPKNNHYMKSSNSLIDWIRLGNSGVDLSGVNGRPRLVSLTELRKHNIKSDKIGTINFSDDAWLAIRGRVYNITQYLSYHPGGADELMRGAGKDATELFDKIHPWINYDSLLVKCFVGTLRIQMPDRDIFYDATDFFPESDLLIPTPTIQGGRNKVTNYTTPPRKKSPYVLSDDSNTNVVDFEELSLPGYLGTLKVLKKEESNGDVPPALFYDWDQTSTKLTISVFTGPSSNPGAYSRIADRTLLIEVTINGWLRTLKLIPEEALQEPIKTTICFTSGKIQVTAYKADPKQWKNCGEVILGTPTKMSTCKIMEYEVVSNKRLTHDTTLLTICPRIGSVVFPVGHHIRVHQTVAGSEYVRSYTPVGDLNARTDNSLVQLAVKRYDNGILSPFLSSLSAGDVLKASGPHGTFQLHKLKTMRTIYLLAAGTGITPMLGLIKFVLAKSNPASESIYLLYFNKTEKDIMFQEYLEDLTNKDHRFYLIHILSNASAAWTGRKGRINAKLLTELLDENYITDEDSRFAAICGPKEFTFASLNVLRCLGMEEFFIHPFIG